MKTIKPKKMKRLSRGAVWCNVLLGAAAGAGMCLPAVAQDAGEATSTGEQIAEPNQAAHIQPITVAAGASYQMMSHLDSAGRFNLERFRTGIGVPIKIDDQWSVATSFKYELDSFHFKDTGGMYPWGNVNTFSGVALVQYRLDEKWLIYGGPIVRGSAESGASWGQAVKPGAAAAFNYFWSDTFSIGGGFLAMGQIKDDEHSTLFLPIITLNWKFADDWRLKVGFTDLATGGYGADVLWDFHPQWQADFGLALHKNRFRIEGNGANGSTDGVGQESGGTLTAALNWMPCKEFTGTGFVGATVGGKVRTDNSSGIELNDTKYKTTGIIGLKATFNF